MLENPNTAQNYAHRNDVWRTDDPSCGKNFQVSDQNFNAHAKFTIIEEVYNKLLSNL